MNFILPADERENYDTRIFSFLGLCNMGCEERQNKYRSNNTFFLI